MIKVFVPVGRRRTAQIQALAENGRTETKHRLDILDSIRGWAAVVVMVFHIAREMFANKLPEFGTFWPSCFNGGFAVAIFFVVSGEALSHGYFVKNDTEVVRRLALKRYVRLTIPIFASCLIVFALMKTHVVFSHEASVAVVRPDWLGRFLSYEPSIASLLSYSLFGVYFSHPAETSYNPILWSMSVEFGGSLFVFLTLFVTQNRAQRWGIFALTTPFMIVFSPYLICFIAGMVFSEMRVAGMFERFASFPITNWACSIALGVVVVGLTVYPLLGLPNTAAAQRLSIASAVFLFAIYSSSLLQFPLNNRVSHFLGELSFPIYLVHFPVIISLESFLILRLCPDGVVTRPAAYFIILVAIATSLLAATAFLYIERLAIRASNSFLVYIDSL